MSRVLSQLFSGLGHGTACCQAWSLPCPTSCLAALVIVAASLSFTGCAMDTYAGRGATMGSLSGAALGAAIGEHNDAPLLGAAVGALAGGAVGNGIGSGIDRDVSQREYMAQQASLANVNSVFNEVVQMSQQGVGEEIIVNHIRTRGVPRPPNGNEIVMLKQQGVSDRVITAMQSSVAPASYQAQPSRVVVETVPYWGPPPAYYYHPRPHHYHYHGHRRGGVSWGVSFCD